MRRISIKDLSDEDVVRKVIANDKELYRELVTRYEGKLVRYATFLTNDEHKASDIVQNTFIKAFINLKGFDCNKKFSSWIYRIAHNEAINCIRKDKNEVRLEIDYDAGVDMYENTAKNELIKNVKECVNDLPEDYREVLVLYYMDDKSYEEISDILRIPMGTVGTRISRGKMYLAKICKKQGIKK